MKHILAISALIFTNLATSKCIDEPAKAYMLWKEARGESLRTQRAVLDVLYHRMRKSNTSACTELMKASQYPYFRAGLKPVSNEWLFHYRRVRKMPKVLLDKKYLYFNHYRSPHIWGRNHKRIGNLVFSQ